MLHDGAEGIIGDMPGPFKHQCADYMYIEALIMQGIAEKFDIPPELPHEVKRLDNAIRKNEALVLFSHLQDLSWAEQWEGCDVVVEPWGWQSARQFRSRPAAPACRPE